MKRGDLLQIKCDAYTCPMYPDEGSGEFGQPKSHIGYAPPGIICLYLGSQAVSGTARAITFSRVMIPEHGIVWVRKVWLKELP